MAWDWPFSTARRLPETTPRQPESPQTPPAKLQPQLETPEPETASRRELLDTEQHFIKQNKALLASAFLGISFASLIWSIRKKTRGTRDFGLERLMKEPALQGNVQHASWIWAIRAFALSTSVVGLGAVGMAVGVGYYMNVSSLKEFSVEFRKAIHRKFPSLAIPDNQEAETKAMGEFMREWKHDLDEDDPAPKAHNGYISGIITEGLGPLGKFTAGGQKKP
ncbi:hypothetical protein HDU91_005483 [Kappamyces sp. JEL0680]|nr:hypothetical protein HDU91_005483 [Kappamyces sp. JEL0680]